MEARRDCRPPHSCNRLGASAVPRLFVARASLRGVRAVVATGPAVRAMYCGVDGLLVRGPASYRGLECGAIAPRVLLVGFCPGRSTLARSGRRRRCWGPRTGRPAAAIDGRYACLRQPYARQPFVTNGRQIRFLSQRPNSRSAHNVYYVKSRVRRLFERLNETKGERIASPEQQQKRGLTAMCRDLFGEVAVTWDEVYEWVESVANISRDSWRAKYYIEHWNVPDKIRAAKLAGTM